MNLRERFDAISVEQQSLRSARCVAASNMDASRGEFLKVNSQLLALLVDREVINLLEVLEIFKVELPSGAEKPFRTILGRIADDAYDLGKEIMRHPVY